MAESPAEDPDIDLLPVLSGTLAEACDLPLPLTAQLAKFKSVLWLCAVFVAVGVAVIVIEVIYFTDFFQNAYIWAHANQAWLLPILIFLLFLLIGIVVEILIPAWSAVAGMRNERSGRGQQAAACYRRALRGYLHGWFPLFRIPARILGIYLFISKGDVLDLQPEEVLAVRNDVQRALERLQNIYSRFFGERLKFIREILDFAGTALELTYRIDRFEADPEEGDLGELGHLGRGIGLYQLGQYENAVVSFDRAIQASEGSGEPLMPELARVGAVTAIWEIGDLDECERRLREMLPEDIDYRLMAISLECRLACARGDPEKAVAILERIALHLPAKGVDPNTLADLALVRATALRTARRYEEALPYASQAVAYYQQYGPMLAFDPRLEVAYALEGLGRRDEAVAVAARSAAELDDLRYQLGRTSNRLTFASANEKARALALELAVVSAPRLAAELVESARVQGMPKAKGPGDDRRAPAARRALPTSLAKPQARALPSATFAADEGSRSAALTAAGEAPLTPPPRLDLFASGDSRLGRLAPGLPSAGQIVLAEVAEAVAGKEWWWWGSWAAGGQLYWSLIGHNGTVEAGGIPIASLQPALTRLARALPTLLEGETGGNVDRAKCGPLAQPDTAAALADELGELLIPRTLKDLVLARAASGEPLSLVVAPAPELGRVPFGLLGLGKAGAHLAHGAVVRLGASAALLEQIRRREPRQFDGRVLCVVDPCDDAPLLPDGQLQWMGVTSWQWLRNRPLLSRSGHLPKLRATHPAEAATIDELSKALRTTDAGVFAFIGHVGHTPDEAPASAYLVLDDGSLSASDLLYDHDPRKWPMPSRVALIGCGSAGAQAPEWLGLAPASLWAGAQVVAATAWDLIDEPASWQLADEVVSVLHRSPDPAAAWREHIIDHLAEWKSHKGASPLCWGAVQFVGLGEPDSL